jgi:ubiquinone/menaquinone biosynthesis C-methylase UbiE
MNLSYEASVLLLRSMPEHAQLIKLSYLDEDNLDAAKRFSLSQEFTEVVKLLALDKATKPLKILDLGCGNGIASYCFANLGHEVTSVDPDSSSAVGLKATEKLSQEISLPGSICTVQSFAESLPFKDETFDIVYTRQCLHHFYDLYQGLLECQRVLKPCGKILSTREHVISDDKQLEEFLRNHILHQLHGGEKAYTLGQYSIALKSAGFKNIKAIGPYDSIINYFPVSEADIDKLIYNAFKNKLGLPLASALIMFPIFKTMYKKRMSRMCTFPGRLYSFYCTK